LVNESSLDIFLPRRGEHEVFMTELLRRSRCNS